MNVWRGKWWVALVMWGLWIACPTLTALAVETGGAARLAELLNRGRFGECVELVDRALKESVFAGDELALRMARAKALVEMEKYPEALAETEQALKLVTKVSDRAREGELRNLAGTILMARGKLDEAGNSFGSAVEAARATNNPALLAKGLNNLAILQLQRNNPAEALRLTAEGLSIAEKAACPDMMAKLRLTRANAQYDLNDISSALLTIATAHDSYRELPPSYERAKGLLVIGDWYARAAEGLSGRDSVTMREKATSAYRDALAGATALDERRLAGYAAGGLGGIEERNGNFPEALSHTRMALFLAQKDGFEELLYLWQWQAARILRTQGSLDEALRLNRMAVETLQTVRHNFVRGDVDVFRKQIKPVYLDLADLLLARASRQKDPSSVKETLAEVLRVFELLRSDEMKDYLRDACVETGHEEVDGGKLAERRMAIMYYIVFEDRIEALLNSPAGLRRFTVGAPVAEVASAVRSFRRMLERRDGRHLTYARKLHELLVAPAESYLNGVETLVFASDGMLRMIPMAALHDGKRYLLEKYAITLTQGVALAEGGGRPYADVNAFLGGISKETGGMQEIPFVNQELGNIQQLFSGALLKNEMFTIPSIDRELRGNPYSVLHIASHGQFQGDVANTFVLTWDGRMDIDQLARFVRMGKTRREPLDLLTLSACSTAAGDDRAMLGLAGVALKAGARNAIASLWDVDDRATSTLFTSFYRILKHEPSLSKAGALRKAQLMMLRESYALEPPAPTRGMNSGKRGDGASDGESRAEPSAYSHPFFWAPFVVTGNWL